MDKVNWLRGSMLEDSEVFKKFEQDFNIVLPAEFKEFAAANNSAMPIPDTIDVDGFGETDVKMLLSFNKNDAENIFQIADRFIKNGLVPFAPDSIGNYFCLSGENMIFWEHETDTRYDMKCGFCEFLELIH